MTPDCECKTWARDYQPAFWTVHHERCPKYDVRKELLAIIEPLIDGVESWAADEDGVHPDCWEAYERACLAVSRRTKPLNTEGDDEPGRAGE